MTTMVMVVATVFAVLLCTNCYTAWAFTDGFLPNGGFEQGPKPSDLDGTIVIGRKAIPNWEISGYVEYIKSGQQQDNMLLLVPEGKFAIRLGNEASIKQTVKNVTIGMHYSLSFSVSRTCAQEERLNISIGSDFGVLPMGTMYSSNGWDSYSWASLAKKDEVEVIIHNPMGEKEATCGPLIDSIAMRSLHPPRPSNQNVLKNGDFEEGPYIIPNTTWGVVIPPNIDDENSPLPGWIIESLKAVRYIDSKHFSVPEGRRAVELIAGKESVLTQYVRTFPNKEYVLTFAVGDGGNACSGSLQVEAFAGSETVEVKYESKGKGGFIRGTLRFTAASKRTRIMFLSSFYTMRSDDLSSLCGPIIDDVKLISVRWPAFSKHA